MEKKTIGKFIAALRKANGMTQRELGERLFVSDKTVSRWECDECTPELSLIPSIAEIFGITTDELLRGERRSAPCLSEQDAAHSARGDKQFKLMLDSTCRRYNNLTLISIGITVFGFICALVADLGFSRGLIAFCFSAIFCVASEICQICFARNARICLDNDDAYADKINDTNNCIVKSALKVTLINILVLAFCLPTAVLINGASFGLIFPSWLLFGSIFSFIAFVLSYVIYVAFIHGELCKRGLLTVSESVAVVIKKNRRSLIKTVIIALLIALVLWGLLLVLDIVGFEPFVWQRRFENPDDFKRAVERDYKNWLIEGYSYVNEKGETAVQIPPDHKVTEGRIRNADGKVICEYYYNPDLYYSIKFSNDSFDKMPVTVITKEARANAQDIFYTLQGLLVILIVVDFIASFTIHLIKMHKKDKNTVKDKMND